MNDDNNKKLIKTDKIFNAEDFESIESTDFVDYEDIHLENTLTWIVEFIEKKSKKEYVSKKNVEKIISKIANDLNISSQFFGNFNF